VPQLNASEPQGKLLTQTNSVSFPPVKNAVSETPPQASNAPSRQANVLTQSHGQVTRTTNSQIQPPLREPPSPAQTSKSEPFNLILFLQTKGLKVIDNRAEKGGIWVIGGNELSTMMQMLATKGFQFKFIPGGVPSRSGLANYYIDGWFLRSYTDSNEI
jgi:hypothetical protein